MPPAHPISQAAQRAGATVHQVPAEECKAKGGQPLTGSPGDPARG